MASDRRPVPDSPIILYNGESWQSVSAFGRDNGYTNPTAGARKVLGDHKFPKSEQLHIFGITSWVQIPLEYRAGEKDIGELKMCCLGSEYKGKKMLRLGVFAVLHPIYAMKAVVHTYKAGLPSRYSQRQRRV